MCAKIYEPVRRGRPRNEDGYSLFQRGLVYYFQTYDARGRRTIPRSTGQTSERAARGWIMQEFKENRLVRSGDPLFRDYTESWWLWDTCPYVLGKRERGKKKQKIGRTYVDICRGYLTRHLWPRIGDLHLSAITPGIIEEMVRDLLKAPSSHGGGFLSPTTVNQILAVLKVIFKEGVRKQTLSYNPAATVEPLEEERRERSFLTPAEIRKLFDEKQIGEVWGGDVRHYTLNILAASTGMRLGEIQALQRRFVFTDYIQVEHGWTRYGLKDPKAGQKRCIPLPTRTAGWLKKVMTGSPYKEPQDLVFWGRSREKPMAQTYILDTLYSAFDVIGVAEEDRAKRNISFHSWRHFFNTSLRGKVADAKLQKLTGHRTMEMTENYTHFSVNDFADVRLVQEDMLGKKGRRKKVAQGGSRK